MNTYTEDHRHACEVRYVLSITSKQARRDYLEGVEKKRGAQAANRLKADVYSEWEKQRKGER